MTSRGVFAYLAAPLAFASACAMLLAMRHVELKTSIYDLVGDVATAIPAAVRDRSSNVVPVIVSSPDFAAARSAAESLAERLSADDCGSVRCRFAGDEMSAILDVFGSRCAGLVSERDASLLATAEGRSRLARAAARKYYSSPIPPLFAPAKDPFCLADGFVASLPRSVSGWGLKEGVLAAEQGGVSHVLVSMTLKRSVADDTDALVAFRARLRSAIDEERLCHAGVEYSVCGVPMHTAAAAGRCKSEIGWLTCVSLLFIAMLSALVFGSVKWIPLLASTFVVAASAGALVLALCFSSVHVMSLVLGTTVLGLVVDYSFHWLLQAGDRRREVVWGLLVSFATTEISFLPLVLSTLPILRQSFVFLGVGLAAALAFVLLAYPRPESGGAERSGVAPHCGLGRGVVLLRAALLLVLAVAVFGLFRVRLATDPQDLYRPDAEIAAAEKLFAELGGTADSEGGFVVTSGSDDLETLLEREAAVGLPESVPCASRVLLPLSRRLANVSLEERLREEQGERQCELLGLAALPAIERPLPWQWEDVPQPFVGSLVVGNSLVARVAAEPEGPMPEGVAFCRPKETVGRILSDWTSEARNRLGASFLLMFAVLAVFFRRSAPAVSFPSVFAVCVVWGALSVGGASVNLFHVLACFLLVGMSVDYTVFLRSGGRAALKPVLCSLLTSMVGFGALSFVSFPVVSAFGKVMGLGLPTAFLCAVAMAPGRAAADSTPQTEHGASPLGLEILFLAYRVFGLRALHFCSACVGLCVWAFSGVVRRASPSPRKIAAFACSLADKLVVMAEGPRLPKVELDGSRDAVAFAADVAARKGVFVLSSHCGTIEVLAALGECDVTFHAWMEFSRTSVFNRFYMRHARRGKVVIHPISEFGMETVFEAGDALDSGDCLVMAGDRGFGRMMGVPFRGGELELPEGAFRFANSLGHPVYFVACVATGPCRYRAVVRRLPSGTPDMARSYASALDEVSAEFPEQWFRWEGDA